MQPSSKFLNSINNCTSTLPINTSTSPNKRTHSNRISNLPGLKSPLMENINLLNSNILGNSNDYPIPTELSAYTLSNKKHKATPLSKNMSPIKFSLFSDTSDSSSTDNISSSDELSISSIEDLENIKPFNFRERNINSPFNNNSINSFNKNISPSFNISYSNNNNDNSNYSPPLIKPSMDGFESDESSTGGSGHEFLHAIKKSSYVMPKTPAPRRTKIKEYDLPDSAAKVEVSKVEDDQVLYSLNFLGQSFQMRMIGKGHDHYVYEFLTSQHKTITIGNQQIGLSNLVVKMARSDSHEASQYFTLEEITEPAVGAYQDLRLLSQQYGDFFVPSCYVMPDYHKICNPETANEVQYGAIWVLEKIPHAIDSSKWESLEGTGEEAERLINALDEASREDLYFGKKMIKRMQNDPNFHIDDFKPDNVRRKIDSQGKTQYYVIDFSDSQKDVSREGQVKSYIEEWSKGSRLVKFWLEN
jgi:hypothetical protein